MDEIEKYQNRVFAALEKISDLATGLKSEPDNDAGPDISAELQSLLETERQNLAREKETVARLSSQIEDLKNRPEPVAQPAPPDTSGLQARIDALDTQVQRLKDANTHLRQSNTALREKNLEKIGDVGAVNASLQAELEALKVARAADVDEMDAILDELRPMVGGAE